MPDEWKKPFEKGVKAFREKKFESAVQHFTKSIALDGAQACVYDSRAAAYEQLQRFKESLMDARKCISLAPDRYMSYFRSARIFLALYKLDRCVQMIEAARKRLQPSDAAYPRRIEELAKLETAACLRRRERVDPLTKLPLELLMDICKMAIEGEDARASRGAGHFAVTLGSVCRSLRELVHSTPGFWQCLAMSHRHLAKKVPFWLERLAGQPLYSVSLFNVGAATDHKLQSFFSEARPELWKHLRLEDSTPPLASVYRLLRTYELKLYSLSLVSTSTNPSNDPYYVEELSNHLVPLPEAGPPHAFTRSLSLRVQGLVLPSVSLPSITHLELCSGHWTAPQAQPMIFLLHSMPNLRSLVLLPQWVQCESMTLLSPPIPDPKVTSVLRLPFLKSLRAGGPILAPTPITFQFPALEILELERHPLLTTTLISQLGAASQEDKAPIRQLHLSRTAISPEILKTALATFSDTLESFELAQCSAVGQDFYDLLSSPLPGGDGSILCPRLRDVNFSGMDELKAGPLVRMIKAHLASSNTGATPIRNVIVDACPNVDAETLPWMRANVTGIVSCLYKTRNEAKGRKRDRYL